MAADGLFINIEGPDASGKETQWNLLVERLQEQGFDVYKQDFPAYDRTGAGQQLKEYLQGDEDLPTREETQLFIDDRRALKEELVDALEDGKVVVTDRYAQSNWAYQTAGMDYAERWEFIDWMKEAEADLPQPDVTLYIDMPVDQSLILIENRDGDADKNENEEKLEQVVAAYREIAEEEDWIIIDPMKEEWNGQKIQGTEYLRTPENIHEDMWDAVEPYLLDN